MPSDHETAAREQRVVDALAKAEALTRMAPYEDGQGGWLFRWPTSAEVADRLRTLLAYEKAEAWDEGFQDGRRQDAEGDDGPRFTNPYRTTEEQR